MERIEISTAMAMQLNLSILKKELNIAIKEKEIVVV